jgi:hypothetical protein
MSLNTAIVEESGQLTLKAQEKIFFQQGFQMTLTRIERIRMDYGSGR